MNFKQFLIYCQHTLRAFPAVISYGWFGLLGLVLLSSCLTATITHGKVLLGEGFHVHLQILQFIVDLGELLFLWAFTAHYFNRAQTGDETGFAERVMPRLGLYFYSAFTVLGRVILWSLLFILPGIYKQVVLGAFACEVLLPPLDRVKTPLLDSTQKVRPVALPGALFALIVLAFDLFALSQAPLFMELSQVLVFFLVNFINILVSVFYWGTFYSIYIAHQGTKESQ